MRNQSIYGVIPNSSTHACKAQRLLAKSKTPTNGKEAQAALPSVCRGSSEDLFFRMTAGSETPASLAEVPASRMATRAAIELKSISLFPAIAVIESTTQINSAVLNSLGTGLWRLVPPTSTPCTTAAERAAWISAYVAGIKRTDPGFGARSLSLRP